MNDLVADMAKGTLWFPHETEPEIERRVEYPHSIVEALNSFTPEEIETEWIWYNRKRKETE